MVHLKGTLAMSTVESFVLVMIVSSMTMIFHVTHFLGKHGNFARPDHLTKFTTTSTGRQTYSCKKKLPENKNNPTGLLTRGLNNVLLKGLICSRVEATEDSATEC